MISAAMSKIKAYGWVALLLLSLGSLAYASLLKKDNTALSKENTNLMVSLQQHDILIKQAQAKQERFDEITKELSDLQTEMQNIEDQIVSDYFNSAIPEPVIRMYRENSPNYIK